MLALTQRNGPWAGTYLETRQRLLYDPITLAPQPHCSDLTVICHWRQELPIQNIFSSPHFSGLLHHDCLLSLGHFVSLEATPVGLKGDKAHIRSSVWKESSAICKLAFWYYISHMSSGTIRLLIQVKQEHYLVVMLTLT